MKQKQKEADGMENWKMDESATHDHVVCSLSKRLIVLIAQLHHSGNIFLASS